MMDELLVRALHAVFQGMRERLSRGWCQRAFALDRDGDHVNSSSPYADRWCWQGAFNASLDDWMQTWSQQNHDRVSDEFLSRLYAWLSVATRRAILERGGIEGWYVDEEGESKPRAMSPAAWNDRPETTQEDVLELLDTLKRWLPMEELACESGHTQPKP